MRKATPSHTLVSSHPLTCKVHDLGESGNYGNISSWDPMCVSYFVVMPQ